MLAAKEDVMERTIALAEKFSDRTEDDLGVETRQALEEL